MSALPALWRALTAAQRRSLAALALMMLASAIAELFALGSVIPFLAALAAPESLSARFGWLVPAGRDPITVTTAAFLVAALIAGAARLGLALASLRFLSRLAHQWAVEVQRRLLLQPYRFHLEHHSSNAIALTDRVDQFAYGVVQPLLRGISGIVIGVALGALLIVAAPAIAIGVLALLAAIYVGVSMATSRRLSSISTMMSARHVERVRIVQDSFGGVRDLILDGLQHERIARFAAADLDIQLGNVRGGILASAPRILVETAAMIGVALLALWLAKASGGLPAALPVLGLIALAGQRLLPVAQQLYAARTQMAINATLTDEVIALLQLPVPAPPAATEVAFKQEIRIDSASFTYPGRTEPALSAVSLVIRPGARVGIVGPSGGGKSTLADLIMGLIEPDTGTISIDERTLDAAATAGWQRHIGHVAQAVFLVDDSIARNIAIDGKAIDRERLDRAASATGVDAIVAPLVHGYETKIGERGGRLSGGQRQRLAFARALYKRPAMLVLDEATSALDDRAERDILCALAQIPGLTTILIAHRQSTIADCDVVFHVENGRVRQVRP